MVDDYPALLRELADWLDAHPLPPEVRVIAARVSGSPRPKGLQLTADPASVPWADAWSVSYRGIEATHWHADVDGEELAWVGPPLPLPASTLADYGGAE